MKYKRVFIVKEFWSKINMDLTSLAVKEGKSVFTTQFFAFDGATITWMAVAFIIGIVIGVNIN